MMTARILGLMIVQFYGVLTENPIKGRTNYNEQERFSTEDRRNE